MIGTVIGTYTDPAGRPLSGRVRITPTPGRILMSSPPRTSLGGVDLIVDSHGQVREDLDASVDNPTATPDNFTYVAEFDLRRGRVPVYAAPFFFKLGAGQVVDLTMETPAAEDAGVPVVRGPGLPDPAAGIDGQVVVLTDGIPGWGDLPASPPPTVLELSLTAPVPAGTPSGTFIYRTQEVAP